MFSTLRKPLMLTKPLRISKLAYARLKFPKIHLHVDAHFALTAAVFARLHEVYGVRMTTRTRSSLVQVHIVSTELVQRLYDIVNPDGI